MNKIIFLATCCMLLGCASRKRDFSDVKLPLGRLAHHGKVLIFPIDWMKPASSYSGIEGCRLSLRSQGAGKKLFLCRGAEENKESFLKVYERIHRENGAGRIDRISLNVKSDATPRMWLSVLKAARYKRIRVMKKGLNHHWVFRSPDDSSNIVIHWKGLTKELSFVLSPYRK